MPYSICLRTYFKIAVACVLISCRSGHDVAAQTSEIDTTSPATASATRVQLSIDFGDGFTKSYEGLAWKAGDTVKNVLDRATKHPHPLSYTMRGKGETAFLMALDGRTNQGAGKRNWMFSVDGTLAKQSFATTEVAGGAHVLWHFRPFKYNAGDSGNSNR